MNPHFKKLTISGWRQFHNVSIEFHPRLTVITGSNGAGKSTLLNLLTPQFGWHRNFLGTPGRRRRNGAQQFYTGVRRSRDMPLENAVVVGTIDYSNGATSQMQVGTQGQQYGVSMNNQQPVVGTFISSHRSVPVFRPVNQISTSAINADQAYSMYQSEAVQRFSGQHNNNSHGSIYRLKETLVSLVLFGTSSDLATGDDYALKYFQGFVNVLRIVLPVSLGFRDLSIRVTDVVMETSSGNFIIDAASGGVMSIIDMAWQIYTFSQTTQAANTASFTVIMDEPENHLHPSMQRTLLANLLDAFPKAQFIVATHSPFMVSSVKDSFVYALRYSPVELDISSDDGEESLTSANLVFSEKLDVINRAGNAAEILRDVLGVAVTVPLWVEEQLDMLVAEYRNREINVEALNELRIRMTNLGFGEMYPIALAGVVEGK